MKGRANRAVIMLTSLTLLAILVCAPKAALSQEKPDDTGSTATKDSAPPNKVKLRDATRVSTDEAARQAANKKAKDTGVKPPEKKASETDQGNAASSPVTELQAAGKSEDESAVSQDERKGQRNSRLGRVHGSVQAATGSGTRQGGGELGAGTKSGKTHVYVETERTRSDTPQPH